MSYPECSMLAVYYGATCWLPACYFSALRRPSPLDGMLQEVAMHWSRELLVLTAGVRWRIAGLVVIGLLMAENRRVGDQCRRWR